MMDRKNLKLPNDGDEIVLKLADSSQMDFNEDLVDPMKSGLLGPDPIPQGRPLRKVANIRLYHKVLEDADIYQSAGMAVRFLAFLFDSLFIMVTYVLIYNPLADMLFTIDAVRDFIPVTFTKWIVCAACLTVYFVFPGREHGISIGKRALGLRVVSMDNNRLGFMQLVAREVIGKPISLLFGVGVLLAPFTSQHRALHDYLANTRVVKFNFNDPD